LQTAATQQIAGVTRWSLLLLQWDAHPTLGAASLMNLPGHESSSMDETWERFKSTRGRELQTWLEAELALTRDMGASGIADGVPLMAAEAALQSAIVDFAASQNHGIDPTPLALGLLRLAEHALAESTGITYGQRGHQQEARRRGVEGRRRHRAEN
jgi:hypothetical protein